MSWKNKKFKLTFSQEDVQERPAKTFRRSSSFNEPTSTNGNCFSNGTVDLTSKDQDNKIRNLIPNQQSVDWLEYFAPQTINELAIHVKKVEEVQDWFKYYESSRKTNPARILLISGPAGCGKTATVRVVAKTMDYNLIEWINPVDIESADCNIVSCTTENCLHQESQTSVFKRFLFRSSRYSSLFDNQEKKLILVEDIPNALIRDTDEFQNILSEYNKFGKSPLIFIVTDSKKRSLNISYYVFTDHIRSQINIKNISFNPISMTLMKKALKNISCKLKQGCFETNIVKIPNDDTIESIIFAAEGDIRNAILNLHLISLKGVPELRKETVSSNSNNKRKKAKKLVSVGRDEILTTVHAIGRVMYPKYQADSSPQVFVHLPEEITDTFLSDSKHFLDLIHANYLSRFKNIEDIVDATDYLSTSDILLNEYRMDNLAHIGLNLAIRGIMVSNRNPSAGWAPVKAAYKPSQKNKSGQEDFKKDNFISSNTFAADYSTYVEIIKNSQPNFNSEH